LACALLSWWFMNHRNIAATAALVAILGVVAEGCSSNSSSSADTVGGECDTVGVAMCRRLLVDCAPPNAGSPTNATVGDQCNAIAQRACAAESRCGNTTPTDTCITEIVKGCCTNDGMCGLPAASDELALQKCESAFDSWQCGDALSNKPPAECVRVVRAAPSDAAINACAAASRTACCESRGTCGRASSSARASIDACVSAVQGADCGALASGSPPSACVGVISPESSSMALRAVVTIPIGDEK
jgi:hypothetical protein